MSDRPPHDQPWDPPAYGQPGYGPSAHSGVPGSAPTNGKAVASLVVGIGSVVLSLCCLGVAGVVAVFLGLRARREISASHGAQSGDGLALTGILTGILGVLVSLGLIVLLVALVTTGNAEYYLDSDL